MNSTSGENQSIVQFTGGMGRVTGTREEEEGDWRRSDDGKLPWRRTQPIVNAWRALAGTLNAHEPLHASPENGKLHSKPTQFTHALSRLQSDAGTCEGRDEVDLGTHANPATEAFSGARHGATKRLSGVPTRARLRTRTLPMGPLVELPRNVRGVPKWARSRMRTLPLGPSVEFPMGSRTSCGTYAFLI